ncbi:MAG: hypothetical protein IRY99_17570 [Isosphaeraceae bacterium]|nr:hypothetical protein [Isosphaeraceae bacterium]
MMMNGYWRRSSLAGALLLALAGCGGQSERTDQAVVVPEPGTTVGGTATTPAGGATGGTAVTTSAAKPAEGGSTAGTAPATVEAKGFGTLKGRVIFDGEPPTPATLVKQGDTEAKNGPECTRDGPILDQRLVVDKETKGVRYALVYIPRPTAVSPEAESAARAESPEFDQKGCVFIPHVLGLVKGQTVQIKSSDPVGHNVNSRVDNNAFNNSILPGGQPISYVCKNKSSRPGEVVCDVHSWMKAYWMVLDNPYITVTDEQGRFELKNVPAGTQKVVVWQEALQKGFLTASSGDPITIQADGETTQDFHIKPEQLRK